MISFIFSVKPEDVDRAVTRLGIEGYGCLGMFVRLLCVHKRTDVVCVL